MASRKECLRGEDSIAMFNMTYIINKKKRKDTHLPIVSFYDK